MIKLRVSKDEALLKLHGILHKTCQKAIANHWQVNFNDHVKAQSVCWLYCWAKTGMGSDSAQREAREVFNAVLNISFNDFDVCPNAHDWAEKTRYKDKDSDIENELRQFMSYRFYKTPKRNP